MMKEGIRGLRSSCKQHKQSVLRTSVGGAQAAIEFKSFELEQTHYTVFHGNLHGRPAHPEELNFVGAVPSPRMGVADMRWFAARAQLLQTIQRCFTLTV